MPSTKVAVTEPSASATLSSVVASVNFLLVVPDAIVTVRVLAVTPKSPAAVIITLTSRLAAGAQFADTVNSASEPSVTPPPPEIETTGTGSSFSMSTLTEPPLVARDTV